MNLIENIGKIFINLISSIGKLIIFIILFFKYFIRPKFYLKINLNYFINIFVTSVHIIALTGIFFWYGSCTSVIYRFF
jgi:ABC-type transporter Mla maintaining outer membrane lipid asymmetry permease subunit MlaE